MTMRGAGGAATRVEWLALLRKLDRVAPTYKQ